MENVGPRAWLLMAAGDDRGHGGNAGYDDQFDAYYSWDSNVPNCTQVRAGDIVALWDKKYLLGVSVIEKIESSRGSKSLNRCPACHTTRISERKRSQPRYRCMKCHHEFELPEVDVVEVDQYTARYDAAWTALDGLLGERELRELAVHAGDINAMRPLDWARFHDALVRDGADRAVERIAHRIDLHPPRAGLSRVEIPEGFRQSIVRVRRGQRQFRDRVLDQQGTVCAFTGAAPARVLEAGHLYSYAALGTHSEYGGLMLRRDVHRLFDDGMLAVDPALLRVDVADDLEPYPQYARLHDTHLVVALHDEQVDWLAKHWEEHRARHLAAP